MDIPKLESKEWKRSGVNAKSGFRIMIVETHGKELVRVDVGSEFRIFDGADTFIKKLFSKNND